MLLVGSRRQSFCSFRPRCSVYVVCGLRKRSRIRLLVSVVWRRVASPMRVVSSRLVSSRVLSCRMIRFVVVVVVRHSAFPGSPLLSSNPALPLVPLQQVLASNECALVVFEPQPKPDATRATQEAPTRAGACVEDVCTGGTNAEARTTDGPDSQKQKQIKADGRIEARLYDFRGRTKKRQKTMLFVCPVGLGPTPRRRTHAPPSSLDTAQCDAMCCDTHRRAHQQKPRLLSLQVGALNASCLSTCKASVRAVVCLFAVV
ncbi:uncharacterized protein J3D65DRAFT_474935 [Phyllosticta citribraziliensis]|uniref:Uncharacterized protein n=1 Tax=Phyllosticta citribraziliensis TaxID=989973 RepID=A0ABR1LJQ3_9PEZI